MRLTKKQWFTVMVVLLYLLVFGVATLVINVMAYQDELAEYEHTCDMIEAGAWPAEVEPSCGEREP